MTIRELAKIAGLSHATVSRALRNDPRQSAATRKLVKELAAKHGYAPHPVVSRLMAHLPHVNKMPRTTIAVITSTSNWSESVFLRELFEAIAQRCKQLGYNVEDFSLDKYDSNRLSNILYARGIDGVILFPIQTQKSLIELQWEKFAAVAIGYSQPGMQLNRVCTSPYENMLLAIKKLNEKGYRRIGLAIEDDLRLRVEDSYVAVYAFYERLLPRKDRIPIFFSKGPVTNYRLEDVQLSDDSADRSLNPAAVADWIRQHRIDAVISNYKPTPEELEAQGLRIPEDVGYLSMDATTPATLRISGIDQQPGQWGLSAVDSVTARLNRHELGLPAVPRLITIRGVWREGHTLQNQSDKRIPKAVSS